MYLDEFELMSQSSDFSAILFQLRLGSSTDMMLMDGDKRYVKSSYLVVPLIFQRSQPPGDLLYFEQASVFHCFLQGAHLGNDRHIKLNMVAVVIGQLAICTGIEIIIL